MKQSAVEELVGEQLPDVEVVQHQWRHQPEVKRQLIVEAGPNKGCECLQNENGGVGDQEKLYRGCDMAGTEAELLGLILHGESV